jgi:hypothetical protein
MKYLKTLLLAVLVMFTFGSAMAQVVVRANIGPHRHWHHRHYHRHWHHRY